MVIDAAHSAEERKALELFFARAAMGRPFVAPPGVPADRIAALRTAFDATLADPAFLDDAKKLNLNVVPVSAGQMTEIVVNAYNTPAEIVRRTMRALGRAS
jgi:tripartite-type tricarboxylate transporter receptor subunit TctC